MDGPRIETSFLLLSKENKPKLKFRSFLKNFRSIFEFLVNFYGHKLNGKNFWIIFAYFLKELLIKARSVPTRTLSLDNEVSFFRLSKQHFEGVEKYQMLAPWGNKIFFPVQNVPNHNLDHRSVLEYKVSVQKGQRPWTFFVWRPLSIPNRKYFNCPHCAKTNRNSRRGSSCD